MARSEATRAALLAAARKLFVENGYAETGTPEIVAAAGVTRGALYHHFMDKRALFLAVVDAESAALAGEIEASGTPEDSPLEMLHRGSLAFLTAMQVPGRTRLLLIDAPAVLGMDAAMEVDARHGRRTLQEGIEAALGESAAGLPVDALVDLLAAAFDRAALAVSAGADAATYRAALIRLIDGLIVPASRSA